MLTLSRGPVAALAAAALAAGNAGAGTAMSSPIAGEHRSDVPGVHRADGAVSYRLYRVRATRMSCAKVRQIVRDWLHGKGRKVPTGEPNTKIVDGYVTTIIDLTADGQRGRSHFTARYR